MTGPTYASFQTWDPLDVDQGERGQPSWALIGLAAAIIGVVLAVGWLAAGRVEEPVVVTDPVSVATAFAHRYAAHQPSVCELATPDLRSDLDVARRCTGLPGTAVPTVRVLRTRGAGETSEVAVAVRPRGEFGAAFVVIGLRRAAEGWSVETVRASEDCPVLAPATCSGG